MSRRSHGETVLRGPVPPTGDVRRIFGGHRVGHVAVALRTFWERRIDLDGDCQTAFLA